MSSSVVKVVTVSVVNTWRATPSRQIDGRRIRKTSHTMPAGVASSEEMPRVYPPLEQKPSNVNANAKTNASWLSPSVIESIAGFTGGTISTLVVHPFDIVKTRLQVNQGKHANIGGSIGILRDILKKEGSLQGLYRGLTPNIIGNSISWGLYFMWYGNIKDLFQSYRQDGKLTGTDYFVASGAAGILTGVATNPIWVIKTRMLSTGKDTPGAYQSITHGAKHIWNTEGLKGFYRGLFPSLFGVTHGSIQFSAYERLKNWRSAMRDEQSVEDIARDGTTGKKSTAELSNFDYLTLGAISKIFAGSITYPYQIVRARLQLYDANDKYKNGRDVVKKVYMKEGIAGFYKGLGPNIVRVLPATCVTFLVYENMRIYLTKMVAEEAQASADTKA